MAIIILIILAIVIWRLFPKKGPITISSEKKSIAVLPFSDLSPQKDQAYLCDGMAETIIAKLSSIKEMKVIPSTHVGIMVSGSAKYKLWPELVDWLGKRSS